MVFLLLCLFFLLLLGGSGLGLLEFADHGLNFFDVWLEWRRDFADDRVDFSFLVLVNPWHGESGNPTVNN